jgi:small subunit ribosomal protein S17
VAKVMRKVRTGSVVRTKQDKTAIVEMVWKQRNRLYRKQVRRIARFYVHDPENLCRLGDVVRIEETRPISKTKHWRLMEILERRQVAEVRPIELESDVEPVFSPPPAVDEADLDDETTDETATVEDEGEDAVDEETADEPEEESVEEPEDSADEEAEEESPEEESEEEPEAESDEATEDLADEEASDNNSSDDDSSDAAAGDSSEDNEEEKE